MRLRGSSCRAYGSNLKVRAGENGRNPDALVDCGPRVPGARIPAEPVAIFEVLFRLIALIDESLKLRDYEGVLSIRTYVLLEQERARALVTGATNRGACPAAECRFSMALTPCSTSRKSHLPSRFPRSTTAFPFKRSQHRTFWTAFVRLSLAVSSSLVSMKLCASPPCCLRHQRATEYLARRERASLAARATAASLVFSADCVERRRRLRWSGLLPRADTLRVVCISA